MQVWGHLKENKACLNLIYQFSINEDLFGVFHSVDTILKSRVTKS